MVSRAKDENESRVALELELTDSLPVRVISREKRPSILLKLIREDQLHLLACQSPEWKVSER